MFAEPEVYRECSDPDSSRHILLCVQTPMQGQDDGGQDGEEMYDSDDGYDNICLSQTGTCKSNHDVSVSPFSIQL